MPITNDRADLLRRVRAMLAKAEGTNNEHEADAFRAKAEELMLKYSIAQHELGVDDESNTIKSEPIDFQWYWDSKNGGFLWVMMLSVAAHCQVKVVSWHAGHTIPVVGREQDIRYFDLLFTSLMLEMGKGLEPKPDPDKPMIENLVRMKEAGMKWERIGELLINVGQLDHYNRNVGVRFTKLYTDYCTEHDRPRLRTSPQVYQRSFAIGFTERITERLREIRRQAQQTMTREESGSMAMVLASARDRANAKAIELYGEPQYSGGRRGRTSTFKIDDSAMADGSRAASKVSLSNPSSGLRQQRGLERG